MTSDAEKLGSRIRQYRIEAGLTQEQLGKAIGLTRTSVNNIEHGRQQLLVRTLLEIARAVDVKPEELLDLSDAELPSDVTRFVEAITAKVG